MENNTQHSRKGSCSESFNPAPVDPSNVNTLKLKIKQLQKQNTRLRELLTREWEKECES